MFVHIPRRLEKTGNVLNNQAEMTERALELLCLPDEPCYLLDLGCGSGLSGECIEEQVTFFQSSHGCFSYLGRGMCSTHSFSP